MVKFVQHAIIPLVFLVIQEITVYVIRVQTTFGMELIVVRANCYKIFKLKLNKTVY
jgi:membrane-anchored protein YejM (alkaline phosphatase superfamily)